MTHNRKKLEAVAHFLIARVPPNQLGATKLNKMLWFADCRFHSRHGRSITGETAYVRKDNGPCVDQFDSVIRALHANGSIVERSVPAVDYVRREFYAHVEPDLSLFTGEEVDVLLSVANEIAEMTAAEASNLSHDALWNETEPYQRISVAAGAVRVEGIAENDVDWARAAFA